METIWAELVLARVLSVTIEGYTTGKELDAALLKSETSRMHMAEAISLAMAVYDAGLPADDARLAAILEKYGRPSGAMARAVVLQLVDGRIAMSAGRAGVIESSGLSLSLISNPESGRYVRGWHLPQVKYLGDIDG